ncbi:MAG TPA: glycoside hydrolase family 3 N-terminal domain-containing protein, partial [Pyrinomonadaceae bacterium]|nr:glycoside hydrolase family 3 N-terminal domain-containing protein [Pyrinomonadaceae bacterium]
INYHIVTRLLREELGFGGLVVTDDLEMGAISKHYEIEDSVRLAVEAGEDMLLICARPDLIRRGHAALLQAARTGELSEERINASLERIATYRALTQPPLPFDPAHFRRLSDEVAALNRKLNYVYGEKL